ncbi:MarC family protein [bacterium]|nr:MarC family protein [bacterium]MCP5461724.1 MarC family protein [bacterium]
MMKNIFLAFIPLFVAVDAIGVLPLFVSLTHEFSSAEKKRVIFQSVITALCVACGFIFLGKSIFRFLGITIGDFMVAGGTLLFCIAVIDILNPDKKRRLPAVDFGSVPLGTPLIAGPAVLTTSIIIVSEYGLFAALISIFLNVMVAGILFSFSDVVIRLLGEAGTKALSKVMALLLSAIAVMMIRKGLVCIIESL